MSASVVADGISPQRERREEDAAFDFAERADTDFAMIFPPVFPFEPDAVEHSRGGVKRQPPFACILRALDGVELEAHGRGTVSVLRQ
jgi:hypothetical protein